MNHSIELENELNKLVSAANITFGNIMYKDLKHTPYCIFRFESTGRYNCFQTDYNANIAFDVNRKCLADPQGCNISRNGVECGRTSTHTHRMPNGSIHTFYERQEFDIRHQEDLENYHYDAQNDEDNH